VGFDIVPIDQQLRGRIASIRCRIRSGVWLELSFASASTVAPVD
jgi:hypothetical protein